MKLQGTVTYHNTFERPRRKPYVALNVPGEMCIILPKNAIKEYFSNLIRGTEYSVKKVTIEVKEI